MSKVKDLIKTINSLEERLNWDDYFIILAYLISKRSSCHRLHVGCVITKNNRVISTGYNGHIPGVPHNSLIRNGHEQLTIHAEINTICNSAKLGMSLNNSKAYITHHPCINCTKALIASGVTEIFYAEEYKIDPISVQLLSSAGVKVNKMIMK